MKQCILAMFWPKHVLVLNDVVLVKRQVKHRTTPTLSPLICSPLSSPINMGGFYKARIKKRTKRKRIVPPLLTSTKQSLKHTHCCRSFCTKTNTINYWPSAVVLRVTSKTISSSTSQQPPLVYFIYQILNTTTP